jgi:hypothetical protein
MVDGGQEAPARCIEAVPSCKRLGCSLERLTARCSTNRCHEAIDPQEVADSVLDILRSRKPVQERRSLPLAS